MERVGRDIAQPPSSLPASGAAAAMHSRVSLLQTAPPAQSSLVAHVFWHSPVLESQRYGEHALATPSGEVDVLRSVLHVGFGTPGTHALLLHENPFAHSASLAHEVRQPVVAQV